MLEILEVPVGGFQQKNLRIHLQNLAQLIYPKQIILFYQKCLQKGIGIFRWDFFPDIFCSDLVFAIPDASLFHFGVLTSNVHISWMRAVSERLKSDYRYSKDVVYNNFPWCNPTKEQKKKIEQTAQEILNARALYPNSSLANLYDELTMPSELRKAHQKNDKAAMQAYGFVIKDTTEESCAAGLMKMYQKLVDKKQERKVNPSCLLSKTKTPLSRVTLLFYMKHQECRTGVQIPRVS